MTPAPFVPTFAGWREAARRLLAAGIAPRGVLWQPGDEDQPALDLAVEAVETREGPPPARVPRAFLALADAAACHRDPERWALLYRVLWRLAHGEPGLLEVAVDPDIHRLLRMEKAVRRDLHKMKAFVRFRAVEDEAGPAWAAWFEPEHDIVERAGPFFAERFASMRWSILTPRRCAHWDGESLRYSPGVGRAAAPDGDGLERLWRTYYASVFNPARVKTKAMRAEMPVRYWKNLPEAELIAPLVRDAPARVRRMVEAAREERAPRARRRAKGPRDEP